MMCLSHQTLSPGEKNLLDHEAEQVGGKNHSHATADLFEAIERGDFPEWTLCIQTLDPRDEDRFDFDPLDVTKAWPEDLFPLQPVGRMVLNVNPDNFHNDNESIAFAPAMIVPGIGYSEDKLLQTRIFSYPDTQRHRLGPNYLQLPINAPKCPFHNNHHDGAMNMVDRREEVNYFPSRHDPAQHAQPYPQNSKTLQGQRERRMIAKENNFSQVHFAPLTGNSFIGDVVFHPRRSAEKKAEIFGRKEICFWHTRYLMVTSNRVAFDSGWCKVAKLR